MKIRLSIIFFLLLSIDHVAAQIDFNTNTVKDPILIEHLQNTLLDTPDLDSIQFELRFWPFGKHRGFLQLTIDHQGNWNYRSGYVTRKYLVRDLEIDDTIPKIDSIWTVLLANDILALPTQDSILYRSERDANRTISFRDYHLVSFEEEAEDLASKIEFFTNYKYSNKLKYRVIQYHDSETVLEMMSEDEWNSDETSKFNTIEGVLISNFNMSKILRISINAEPIIDR